MMTMNHTAMMKEIAITSQKDITICQSIVSSYEAYCTKNNKFPFKGHVNDEMIAFISNATCCEASIVHDVIVSMLSIVKIQVKHKIPFIK